MKCSDFCYQNWCLQNVQSYLSNNPRIPNHQQHFNLPCPLTSPYPTQKKHSKQHDLSHLTEKKSLQHQLGSKSFHPSPLFVSKFIYFSHLVWNCMDWLIQLPWLETNQPSKVGRPSDSFGPKEFPPGPWLLKLSRHSLSFAAPESSTPPPCEIGRRFRKMSKRIPTRGW